MTSPIKIKKDHLSQFSSDVESLWSCKPIQILERPPSPIDFLREYVNLSVPVIIKNAFPIVTLDELVESSDSNDDDDDNDNMWLNVDVSPDGHADTIRIVDGNKIFVEPNLRKMRFSEFRDQLRYQYNNDESHQNDFNSIENDDNGLLKFSSKNYVSDRDVSVTNNNGCHEVLYYSRQVKISIFYSNIEIFICFDTHIIHFLSRMTASDKNFNTLPLIFPIILSLHLKHSIQNLMQSIFG